MYNEKYHLQAGKHDYYTDLLFFHRELQCLVAIELKIDDFKPESPGKMQFYLEALDRDVKKPRFVLLLLMKYVYKHSFPSIKYTGFIRPVR